MTKINLLSTKEARRKEQIIQHVSIAVMSLLATILIIIIMEINVSNRIERVEGQVSEVNQKIEGLKKVFAEIQDYKAKQKVLKDKLDIINTLEKNKMVPVYLMDELNLSIPIDKDDTIPQKLWLTLYQESGNNVLLNGVAFSPEIVAKFMTNLDNSQYFGDISLRSTEQFVIHEVQLNKFTISAILVKPNA